MACRLARRVARWDRRRLAWESGTDATDSTAIAGAYDARKDADLNGTFDRTAAATRKGKDLNANAA